MCWGYRIKWQTTIKSEFLNKSFCTEEQKLPSQSKKLLINEHTPIAIIRECTVENPLKVWNFSLQILHQLSNSCKEQAKFSDCTICNTCKTVTKRLLARQCISKKKKSQCRSNLFYTFYSLKGRVKASKLQHLKMKAIRHNLKYYLQFPSKVTSKFGTIYFGSSNLKH